MGFTLIKGTFQVVNYSPDGDSVRFRPHQQELVRGLVNGNRARFNARGDVQLRIEAIDSLETHFSPPSGGGSLHQPVDMARKATDGLLDFLGFSNVVWDTPHRNVVGATGTATGYILSRSVERNGRPVCFVFAGETDHNDGDDVFLNVALLKTSYNWHATSEGLAYLTFYKGLFHDLRDALAAAAAQARNNQLGVYAQDATQNGFDASSLDVITDQASIMPKLFRRLSDFMVNTGSAAGFKEQLSLAREPVLDLRTTNFTHFDTFVVQEPDSTFIKLDRFPEELVFDETIPQPGPVFAAIVNGEMAPEEAELVTA